MISPRFSIIIPCYNSQQTISCTLDSVLAQTYDDYEVIVVNDGSVDNTKDVILSYCDRHSQISLISKGNSGVSTARNRGLEAARGEYVFFLDSDDSLEPYALKRLSTVIDRQDYDIIVFGYREVQKSRVLERKIPDNLSIDPLGAFLKGKINMNIWSMVARKSCYDTLPVIRFDAKTYFSEGDEVLVKMLCRTSKVGYCRDLLYRFQAYPLMDQNQPYSEKHFSSIVAWKRICDFLKENATVQLYKSAYNRLVYNYLKHYNFVREEDRNNPLMEKFMEYEHLIKEYPPFQPTRYGCYNLFQILLFKTSNENI